MIRPRTFALLLLTTSLFAGPVAAQETTRERIVGIADGARRDSVVDALRDAGHAVLEEIPQLGILLVAADDNDDALRAVPGVDFVEPNGWGEGGGRAAPPADTYYSWQWHLENTGQSGGTAGAHIDAPGAWAIQTGSPGVIVAVLDTGIDFAHPEFQGRLLPGYDFVNEDPDPFADHPHGVYVTGLLAANANNNFQVAGVDHACTVLPIKVLDNRNAGSTFDLMQGLVYAADQGADIISMSLINYPGSTTMIQGLSYAAERGSILVACGGNSGVGNADVSWPGASPLTIAIGWTDDRDQRASGSGTGRALDFVAPGDDVWTTSNSPGIDFPQQFSGCSAATPVAAGIVALLKAQLPGMDQACAYALLRAGAADQVGPPSQDTPGWDPFFGHGRLDASASLRALGIDVRNAAPRAGQLLGLDLCGGTAGMPALFAIVELNGLRGAWPLVLGAFDARHRFDVSIPVPAGLADISMRIVGAGIHSTGNAVVSAERAITFR